MKRKDVIRSVVISLGYVLMFLAVDYKLGSNYTQYAFILIIIGAAILFFEEAFYNKLPTNGSWAIGLPAIIRTFAYILLFLGIQVYLVQFVQVYWIWFLLAGFLIYNYHSKIVDMIPGDEGKNYGGGLL